MEYKIVNRWTNACIWSGEIYDAGDDAKNAGAAAVAAIAAEVSMECANLVGANLVRASLEGVNLVGANLAGANLEGANLDGANLVRANLVRANLEGANLVRANLARASLEGANLEWANLDGANLDGANLPNGYRIARLDFGGWPVTVTPTHTKIGCQKHPNVDWLRWEPNDEVIRDMADGASGWWLRHRDSVRAVIRDVMAPELPG